MMLTGGLLVLSRKIGDKRARDKQAKEKLKRQELGGDDETSSISPTVASDESVHNRTVGTDRGSIAETPSEYERPESVSQNAGNPAIWLQTEHVPPSDPVSNERRSVSELSPGDNPPPPYSPTGASTSRAPSIAASSVPDSSALSDGTLSSSSSVVANDNVSVDEDCLRIRTKGSDLKSGFPYAPELFDFRVRPELWERFTAQVVDSTKLSKQDYAQMVGAATATALTGAILTSVYIGRSMNHSLQEKRVKAGLENMSDGGLGDLLKQWNENEFKKLGIFIHLELSASTMKRANHRSPTLSKHPLMYSRREDRERKTQDRKFCLVVTKLDEEGVPADAIHHIVHEAGDEGMNVAEAPNSEDTIYEVPELPGDEGRFPVELPAGVSLGYGPDKFAPNIPELDSTPKTTLESYAPDIKSRDLEDESYSARTHEPLMVTAETHAALHKEIA